MTVKKSALALTACLSLLFFVGCGSREAERRPESPQKTAGQDESGKTRFIDAEDLRLNKLGQEEDGHKANDSPDNEIAEPKTESDGGKNHNGKETESAMAGSLFALKELPIEVRAGLFLFYLIVEE